jgi:hypothetical protein
MLLCLCLFPVVCCKAEDGAARRHSLRQQRLEISWRLVFGVDMQQLVSPAMTGIVVDSVQQY